MHIENKWAFRCTCALCVVEDAESTDTSNRRLALENEAAKMMYACLDDHGGSESKCTVADAEILLADLKATYNPDSYGEVPRLVINRHSMQV